MLRVTHNVREPHRVYLPSLLESMLPCQFYKSTVEPTYSEPWMLSYPKHTNFGEIPCLQPHQS